MDKAYQIKNNLDHVRANQDYDVWQVFQDRKERFHELFLTLEPFDELPPYRFEGKLDKRLSWLDYPRSSPIYPIVSQKFVKTLNSVGQFKHEIMPLTIHDWKLKTLTTDNFVFLHLLEERDVTDRERSIYYDTGGISEIALKEPRGGYPPLFLVRNYKSLTWFVSAFLKLCKVKLFFRKHTIYFMRCLVLIFIKIGCT